MTMYKIYNEKVHLSYSTGFLTILVKKFFDNFSFTFRNLLHGYYCDSTWRVKQKG